MPIVISYDDPALVAQLAGSAGQFATSQQQQQMALQQQAAAQQAAAHRMRMRMLSEQLAAMQAEQQARLNRPAPQPIPVSGQTAGGATIHGWATPDGGLHGVGLGDPERLAAASQQQMRRQTITDQQRPLLDQIDRMLQGGQITEEQAGRWTGTVLAGGNPFTEPTAREQATGADAKMELERFRQENLNRRKAIDVEIAQIRSARTGGALDRTTFERGKLLHSRRVQSIDQELKLVMEQRASILSPDSAAKQKLDSEIERLRRERSKAEREYQEFLEEGYRAAQQEAQQARSSDQSDAGATQQSRGKPVPMSVARRARETVERHYPNLSPERKRALFEDILRRAGFDPSLDPVED